MARPPLSPEEMLLGVGALLRPPPPHGRSHLMSLSLPGRRAVCPLLGSVSDDNKRHPAQELSGEWANTEGLSFWV